MKKYTVVLLAALALGLSACGDSEPPRVIPTVTPTPHVTSTPTQEELSAQAEQTYRAFFAEWKRLQFAGGADEPTQVMLDKATREYVDAIMVPLQQQKADGVTITGPMPTLTIQSAPGGDYEGIDPRLTLLVCEDHTASQRTDASGDARSGDLLQGTIYLDLLEGRPRIVGGLTEPTAECTL